MATSGASSSPSPSRGLYVAVQSPSRPALLRTGSHSAPSSPPRSRPKSIQQALSVSSPEHQQKGLLFSGVYRPTLREGVTAPKRPKTPPRPASPTHGLDKFESMSRSRSAPHPAREEVANHTTLPSISTPSPNKSVGLPPTVPAVKRALPSALGTDTLQWINRHRPKNTVAVSGYIMPSQEIQLREMFAVLDTDKSGEIDIVELRNALKNVANMEEAQGRGKKNTVELKPLSPEELELQDPRLLTKEDTSSAEPLIQDKRLLNDFFNSMDKDGSGTVCFEEFAQAMVSSEGDVDCMKRNNRLKHAFYDLASVMQRQRILVNLQQKEVRDDHTSCDNLRKLFNINYFLNDTVYDSTSVDDKHKFEAYKRDMQPPEYRQRRKAEKARANSAVQRLREGPRELAPLERRKELEHIRQYQFTSLVNRHGEGGSLSPSPSLASLKQKAGVEQSPSRGASANRSRSITPIDGPAKSANAMRTPAPE